MELDLSAGDYHGLLNGLTVAYVGSQVEILNKSKQLLTNNSRVVWDSLLRQP